MMATPPAPAQRTPLSPAAPPKRKGRKLAEITGPAVVTTKKSRRPAWIGEAAAEVIEKVHPLGRAGRTQSTTEPRTRA